MGVSGRPYFPVLCVAVLFSVAYPSSAHSESTEASFGGPTEVSDDIFGEQTWDRSNSPYVLSGLIRVRHRAVLNIKPGTVIKLQPDTTIWISGEIRAQGSAGSPVCVHFDC
jgi:hypothetical protein